MTNVTVTFTPPPEPEAAPPAAMTWAAWQRMIDRHQTPPGWTFCKFGVRGPGPDELYEVVGITKDGFGAYWGPFFLAEARQDGFRGKRELAVAVNARSGYVVGIFNSMDDATGATEIAMRLSDKAMLAEDPAEPEAFAAYMKLGQALAAAGFRHIDAVCRPIVQGEIVSGAPMPIWMMFAESARPEGVSLS